MDRTKKGGQMECIKIQQLIKTLSHFGLNPKDWTVSFPVEKLEKKVMISHKREKGLSLIGLYSFHNSQPMFEEICLHSL